MIEIKITTDSRANQIRRFAWLLPSASDLAFVIPVVVFLFYTAGTRWLLCDSDTGWHIRAGDWILTHHRVPTTDIFSFTQPGQPWIAWEWLSEMSMGLVHARFGLSGIVMGSIVVLGFTSLVVYRNTRVECGSSLIALLVCWLAATASTVHWIARPHLVTPLMGSLFCWALNEVERQGKFRALYFLPAGMVLWVNLHGGFVVGIALPFLYAAGAAAEGIFRLHRNDGWQRARAYSLAGCACFAASFINPFFYRLHVHVAQYLAGPFAWNKIREFQSADFHDPTAIYFETFLTIAIAASIWNVNRGRIVQSVLALGWAHFALFSARNIPLFTVIAAPSIGLAMVEWTKYVNLRKLDSLLLRLAFTWRDLEEGVERIVGMTAHSSIHIFPCFAIGLLALMLHNPGPIKALRPEFDDSQFPVRAADALQGTLSSPNRRVYTDWQWGGFLIYRLWPHVAVFDDGRTDFYGPEFCESGIRVWYIRPGWEKTFDKYGVESALLPVDSSLAAALRERFDWTVIYEDKTAVFFRKLRSSSSSTH